MFDILIIILALILFTVLAFKKVSALMLGPIVSIFVIVFSNLPLYDTLLGPYMESAASYVRNYFLIFFVGAIFGAVMDETRAAESIARSLVKISKGRLAAPIVMMITGILTYGGVSGFVVFFAMYPIALELFRSTNLSRRLIPAAISAGTWTWSMSGPGTPAIQNIIPMRYLGTPGTAALIPATAGVLAEIIIISLWLEYRSRALKNKGYLFHDESLQPIPELVENHDVPLPNPWISFIPIVLILVSFNLFKFPVELAVTLGIFAGLVLMWNQRSGVEAWIETFNRGAKNSGIAILNTAIVVGFGGVVRITSGFDKIISGLQRLKMSPLLFVAITSAIAAGAAGSASGGLGIAYEALGDIYKNLGIDPEYIHRISTIAAGTLDSLPHQGAQITLLAICGLTHKEGYFDIFITQLIIPFVVLLGVVIPMASMGL